jgi:hypothetical protein
MTATDDLLADIAGRLDRAFGRRGSEQVQRDLVALFELCQQQRMVIEQWEAVCQMHCRGAEDIAGLVRSIGCNGVCKEERTML